MLKKLLNFGQYSLYENVECVLRDSKGNIKKLFQPYRWAAWIIKHYGKQLPQNFLFGTWGNSLMIANLVTNTGKAGSASRLGGAGAEAIFNYLAVGIGTTAANVANTTLETEITDSGLARSTATVSRATTTVTDDTHQCVKTWSVTGTKAVTEAGMLNAAAAGVLLSREVFSAINVSSGDSLQITHKIKVA